MVRFAEKHLSRDYPQFFLWILHLAVIARGSITALWNMLRHPAVRDLIICFIVVTVLGACSILSDWIAIPGYFLLGVGTSFLNDYPWSHRCLGRVS